MTDAPKDEKPAHYARLDEIVKARPGFDEACIITRENFAALVGDYSFGEDALCQVESIDAKGHPCRNKHRNGWLGRRKDGKEGLIGSTCGPKYFEGHQGFAANRASVRRELDLDDLTARLGAIGADADFLPRLESVRARLQAVREQSNARLESLPQDVGARLRAMAKSRNSDLRIEIEYPEQVDDELRPGKTHTKVTWVPQTVGVVAGLSIADRAPIHDLQKGVAAVSEAFKSLDARRELGGTKLRSQLRVLESLPSIEAQLVSFETAWSAFARPENLRNLWLLSRRRENQIACMRLAAIAEGSSTSNHLLAAALKDAETALRLANGNRGVRPVGG